MKEQKTDNYIETLDRANLDTLEAINRADFGKLKDDKRRNIYLNVTKSLNKSLQYYIDLSKRSFVWLFLWAVIGITLAFFFRTELQQLQNRLVSHKTAAIIFFGTLIGLSLYNIEQNLWMKRAYNKVQTVLKASKLKQPSLGYLFYKHFGAGSQEKGQWLSGKQILEKICGDETGESRVFTTHELGWVMKKEKIAKKRSSEGPRYFVNVL